MRKLTVAAVAAVLAAGALYAEDDAEETKENASEATAEKTEEKAATPAPAAPIKPFSALPCASLVEGDVAVRLNGETAWQPIVERHYYPLGSSFRTGKRSSLVLSFGEEATVKLEEGSSFATRAQEPNLNSRTIELGTGSIFIELPTNLTNGMFAVSSPGFVAKSLAGNSRFERTDKGDGDEVSVRCVTGTMTVEGRHFAVPSMHPANEMLIRTSLDNLCTMIYGVSGNNEFKLVLDRGTEFKQEFVADSTELKTVTKVSTLEWPLTPKTHVQITRLAPTIGARLSVSVMTFDAANNCTHRYTFCEGRAEVNTPDEIKQPEPQKTEKNKAAEKAGEEGEAKAEGNEEASKDSDTKSDDNNKKEEKEEE